MKKNILYLTQALIMFFLGIINIYIMEWKLVNIMFGVVPFFLLGVARTYKYIKIIKDQRKQKSQERRSA